MGEKNFGFGKELNIVVNNMDDLMSGVLPIVITPEGLKGIGSNRKAAYTLRGDSGLAIEIGIFPNTEHGDIVHINHSIDGRKFYKIEEIFDNPEEGGVFKPGFIEWVEGVIVGSQQTQEKNFEKIK